MLTVEYERTVDVWKMEGKKDSITVNVKNGGFKRIHYIFVFLEHVWNIVQCSSETLLSYQKRNLRN